MKNWEETVMTQGTIDKLLLDYEWKYGGREISNLEFVTHIAQAQAEITAPIFYKEGIQEVVEWIEEKRQKFFIFDDLYLLPEWQAKLKEWRIE